MLLTILKIYFLVAILVAFRVGWHMLFRMDQYDWNCTGKEDIWMTFVFFTVAWPIFILKPQTFVRLGPQFDIYGNAASARERDRLRRDLPPCGKTVIYKQITGAFGSEVCGEFLFKTKDLLAQLKQRLTESPDLVNWDEGDISKWLDQYDSTIEDPSPVPIIWDRFEYLANEVARSGKCQVKCLKCDAFVPVESIIRDDDSGKAGWNLDRLACPEGHNLLVIRAIHVLLAPDD